ncbi:MAG: hypothetical protein AAFP19_24055 [Bacteroidota bacterium]
MKNLFYLLSLSLGLVFFVSCSDDDSHEHHEEGPYEVTINITNPADGAMVMMGEEMTIEVSFTRLEDKTIHNIQVDILDADKNLVQNLEKSHVHSEGEYTYTGKYTPDAAGSFILSVSTTNDSDEEANTIERAFTVMHGGHGGGGDYDVDIMINKPVENASFKMGDAMEVEVMYMAHDGATIHHTKIEVLNENGDVVATLFQDHVHQDGSYQFTSSDYTPDTEGTFRLRAATSNHDMSVEQHAMRSFVVTQ